MNQGLLLRETPQISRLDHPFLQELINQIHLSDSLSKYRHWSDETLVNQLIVSPEKKAVLSKNFNFDPLNQLLTNAFYKAIGNSIEGKTGHITETHIHIRNKEFSSAVIFCDGVLVLNSLIWGYRNFGFLSLSELVEIAENNIQEAVIKASHYLDF